MGKRVALSRYREPEFLLQGDRTRQILPIADEQLNGFGMVLAERIRQSLREASLRSQCKTTSLGGSFLTLYKMTCNLIGFERVDSGPGAMAM